MFICDVHKIHRHDNARNLLQDNQSLRRTTWIVVACATLLAWQTAHAEEHGAAITNGTPELYVTPLERRDITNLTFGNIALGGLVEVEGSFGRESGENVSDIVLATFELNVEAKINDWITGRGVSLWEEDKTEPIDLDEGFILFGNVETIPWSLQLGKMYLPFGAFESHFISDPLVLELGETRQTAALLGYTSDLWEIKAGAFKGSLNDEDQVNEYVARITLKPSDTFAIGTYWVSNLGESDSLSEGLIMLEDGDDGQARLHYKRVGGAGVYMHVEVGRITAEAEYLSALDSFGAGVLGETEMRPRAWNIELAYTVTDDLELAAKYEGTDELVDVPQAQYGVAASYALFDKVTLRIEYLHGTFTGDVSDRDIVTSQVAMEF